MDSNASEPIKNRASLLISHLEAPSFNSIHEDDRFALNQVLLEPFLYRGSHVVWRGMPSNVNAGHAFTSFDLLVGYYDARRIVEGIVRVDYDFAIPMNMEFPVEVLGSVIPLAGGGVRLQGLAINQAGMLERLR